METEGLDPIFEACDETDEVEVLVGLSESGSVDDVDAFCGDDGTVLSTSGFDICRVRLTVECLQEVVMGADKWVDFVEPGVKDAGPSIQTEYDGCL